MNKQAILIVGAMICLSVPAQAQSAESAGAPTITITKLNVTDKTLELRYQIRNDSEQDIWFCEFVNRFLVVERYLAEDHQTIMVRRRLSVPMERAPLEQPIGRYLRLRSGATRTESLILALPISYSPQFAGWQVLPDIVYATRLVIEIGYYVGDLPRRIFSTLEKAENNDTVPFVRPKQLTGRTFRDWLKGSLTFNETNERSRDRDEELIMPWINQTLEGEQVLAIEINDLHIPYKRELQPPKYRNFDLPPFTEAKIHYQPSALEYFLPYAAQRRLLSRAEIQYLSSLKDIEVDEPEDLKFFASEVSRGVTDGIAIAEGRAAKVVCYRDSERLTSFTVYEDTFIETEDKQRLWYYQGLESLKKLTAQMPELEYRVQCATNLKNLWYRLRLYNKGERVRLKQPLGGSQMRYPVPIRWCDAMVVAYKSTAIEQWILKPHKCPSAGEGKNHYALNPNCKPDSPADMVLLFETKAGWNQHGGPELFTFDNHDPEGGCVLLNDGTVKFIRTAQGLQQLRWK